MVLKGLHYMLAKVKSVEKVWANGFNSKRNRRKAVFFAGNKIVENNFVGSSE